jgi:predicted molibdopterin-dependent oxidoreductase YjgC
MNGGERLEAPLQRVGGRTKAAGWKESLAALLRRAGELEGTAVKAVASPFAANEDLAALAALVDALGGGEIVFRSRRAEEEIPLKGFPPLARREDLAPNITGAELLGMKRVGDGNGRGGLGAVADHEGIVLVLGDPLSDQDSGFGDKAGLFVYLGSHEAPAAAAAHFVLPATTHAEQEGSFTNLDRRVQRFWPALDGPGMARPAWLVLGALVAELTGRAAPRSASDAFAALGAAVPAFGGISYEDLGTRGAVVNESVTLTRD